MREIPIIFSAPMVRAILAGGKTQTRRILKDAPAGVGWHCDRTATGLRWVAAAGAPSMPVRLKWAVGDHLWVREAWSPEHRWAGTKPSKIPNGDDVWYWADGNPDDGDWTKPKPSIHMPRWASRITLEVTGVKVERLQDITEDDAVAEGAFKGKATGRIFNNVTEMRLGGPEWRNARDWYADLWESINGAGSWQANPWVTALTFRRVNAANAPARGPAHE